MHISNISFLTIFIFFDFSLKAQNLLLLFIPFCFPPKFYGRGIMVQVSEVLTFEELLKIKNFLISSDIPEFKFPNQKKRFFEKCQKFQLSGDDLIFLGGKQTKIVICKEDSEKIQAILLQEHTINHYGTNIFYYFIHFICRRN